MGRPIHEDSPHTHDASTFLRNWTFANGMAGEERKCVHERGGIAKARPEDGPQSIWPAPNECSPKEHKQPYRGPHKAPWGKSENHIVRLL